jgi:hypothetical protein
MNPQEAPITHRAFLARKITFIIFFLMLFWNIILSFLNRWLGQGQLTYWVEVSYLCVEFGLISIAIWLNRDDLRRLNVDKSFIFILIIAEGLLSIFLPRPFGLVLGSIMAITFIVFRSGALQFGDFHQNHWQTIILVTLLLAPDIFGMLWSGISVELNGLAIFNAAIKANLPQVVIEEVVYRGLLWMFLKNLKLKDQPIIFVQALVFWLSHSFYLSKPFTFWLFLPFQSILYGIIVWRSKSISSSTFGHFLHNLLTALIR